MTALPQGRPWRSPARCTSYYASVGGGGCPPSCQPIPGHCRVRQLGHFHETGSLHPSPAALRRFPRPREGQSPSPTHRKIHFRRGRCLHRPAHRTTNNASVGRRALTPPHWCGGLSNSGLRAARPTQAFQHFRRGGRLCPPVLRRGNLRLPQSKFFRQFSSRCTPGCG